MVRGAKSVVVNFNLGLVAHIAKKNYYKNDQYSFDDLFQEGVFGLVRAIEKFDPTEGCRFSTYSYYWIFLSSTGSRITTGGELHPSSSSCHR